MDFKIFYFYILFIILILSVLSSALPAFAENDPFVKGFNNITQGRICGYVTEREYKKIEISCKYPYSKDMYINLLTSNEDVFEWSVFQEAAKLQKNKNQCLIKVFDDLQKNDSLFNDWSDKIFHAWLVRRQVQLALKVCEDSNKKSSPKWKDFCAKDDNIKNLQLTEHAINYSTPIVGGPEMLDALDQLGGKTLINQKTSKPLTEDEFLDLDFYSEKLYDTIAIDEKASSQADHILKSKLRYFSYEREHAAAELDKKFNSKNKTYDLDSETKDSLFEDNTVYQTLENLKLIDENSNQQSMGSKCLLNHYESSVSSEVLTWLLSAGAASLSFVKLGALARLSTLKNAQKIPVNLKSSSTFLYRKNKLLGAIAASANPGIKESLKSCSSNANKPKLVRKSDLKNDASDAELPETMHLKDYKLSYKSPAECNNLPENSSLVTFEKSSCIQDSLKQVLYVLPLKVALPLTPFINK